MRNTHSFLAIVGSLLIAACASTGQQRTTAESGPVAAAARRPLPYPLTISLEYERAMQRGTRTAAGEPGPQYWQQWADYTLRARVDPGEKRLEGKATILYHNNSPDTLESLFLQLSQNLHAEGAPRRFPQEVTGGFELARVSADGEELETGLPEGPRYAVIATQLRIWPPEPVAPGGKTSIEIDWAFDIPRQGAGGRMGWRDDNRLFLAYWYPQMAVYDDVTGWQADWFLGISEFYAGFASYDLTIEVPEGSIVVATGRLQNPDEVLAPLVIERLQRAEESDDIVHLVTADDYGPKATADSENGWLRWRFVADSVRDVVFGTSSQALWDAARTPVGDQDGDGDTDYSRVDAFYSESAAKWKQMVRYEQHAITFLSEYTGIPYPWPHMTAVESGAMGGGMEYPMMTLIGHYNQQRSDSNLYHVTAHELSHMWQPMIVSSDERRHAWIDEGAATFYENQASKDFFPGVNFEVRDHLSYFEVARSGHEAEIMRWSYLQHFNAYGVASYEKPASLLAALRGVLGEETFLRAYRTFLSEWAYKHPYPWDLFNTFERVSGRNLDWFWRSWYYETWTLDHAVASVEQMPEGTRIVIEDRGLVPMPVHLTITRSDGELIRREVPVETWLAGATTATITVPPGAAVTRVEIDREHSFPDIDRSNNAWIR